MAEFELPCRFGPFVLLRELGRGNFATVFLAQQESPSRLVALKILTAGRFTDPRARRRFYREIELVARLRHPHILAVHDAGEEEGLPYFTMDYVEGPTLAEALREGALALSELVRILRAVAEAVHYAHEQGIVHRDLKPANILLDRQRRPYVADFGLALDLFASVTLTGVYTTVGTVPYMAPEQARGEKHAIGPRTDIYALGAILYEALSGRPPHDGPSAAAVLHKIASGSQVRPPSRLRPGIARDLEAICLRCLEPEPRARYASAAELAEDLRAFQEGRPVRARPRGPLETAWRFLRAHWAALTVAATIVALVAGVAFSVQRARAERHERLQGAAYEALQRARADPLGRGLPELRALWESEPGWRGWKELFRSAARWAEERGLWWLTLRLWELAPPGPERAAARGRIAALFGRLEEAAEQWQQASRAGLPGTERLAEWARRLGGAAEIPIGRGGVPGNLRAADLDGDGVEEIVFVIGVRGRRELWRLVLSRGAAPQVMPLTLPSDLGLRGGELLGAWDGDGDGRDELVFGYYEKSQFVPASARLALLELDGPRQAGALRLVRTASLPGAPAPGTVVRMPDGTSAFAVPILYSDRCVALFSPPREGQPWAPLKVRPAYERTDVYAVTGADADGDGLPELHLATGCYLGYVLAAHERDEAGVWHPAGEERIGVVHSVLAADLDGDGRQEILASRVDTPYDPVLEDLDPAYEDFAGLLAFRYEADRYRRLWARSLRLPGDLRTGPSALAFGELGPSAVLAASTWHETVPLDCCNRSDFATRDLLDAGGAGEPLRMLVRSGSLAADLDLDGFLEIALPVLTPEPRFRIYGLEEALAPGLRVSGPRHAATGLTPEGREELAGLVGERHFDLSLATELLWERPVLERSGNEELIAMLDEALLRLGRGPDPFARSPEAARPGEALLEADFAQPLAPAWSRRAIGSGATWKRGPEGLRLEWTAGTSAWLVHPVEIPAGAPWSLELRFQMDRLDYGQLVEIGFFEDDASPLQASPRAVVSLVHGRSCSPPGGYRREAWAHVFRSRECAPLLRAEGRPVPLGVPLRLQFRYDPAVPVLRILLHPTYSSPTETASLYADFFECPLPAGRRLLLGVRCEEVEGDRTSKGAATLEWLTLVENGSGRRQPAGQSRRVVLPVAASGSWPRGRSATGRRRQLPLAATGGKTMAGGGSRPGDRDTWFPP